MRLAALYRGDAWDPRLHIAVDGGFAAVDELAAAARRPDLAGLRDVGDLYARGSEAVAQLRDLAAAARQNAGRSSSSSGGRAVTPRFNSRFCVRTCISAR